MPSVPPVADLIPDWTDPSAYPSSRELNLEEWRWEFLRRNRRYRADYYKPDEEFEPEPKGLYFQHVHKLLYPVTPTLSVQAIRSHEHSLDEIFPVSFDATVMFSDWRLSLRYSQWRELRERFLDKPEPRALYLKIDLMRPLAPQFRELMEIVREAQRSWNRGKLVKHQMRRNQWPLYLRVLDARESGAAYSAIARTLIKNTAKTEQAARDVVKAAEKLRDHWPF